MNIIEVEYVKKTAKFLAVFIDKKREVNFKNRYKIGQNSFSRERKLSFDKMMTMIIKKVINPYRIV